MTVTGDWSLPVLISTHKPFVFSFPHPVHEGRNGVSLLSVWSPTRVYTCISQLCDVTTVIQLCSFFTAPSQATTEISFPNLVFSVLSLVMLLWVLIPTSTYSPTQSNHWHLVYLKIKSNFLEFNLLHPPGQRVSHDFLQPHIIAEVDFLLPF